MKYQLKIYYRTEHTKEVSEWVGRILADWGPNGKQLEICRTFEFRTDEPLSQDVKDRLVALKEDWMEKVELEEITEQEAK
ncbi:unnamed protein product [marine sediment metagenome]|uniref:Uncharacterized protein n=1 Tax=marine sediment metagenome TaxID=412755 RepID=X1U392_9ZZZZ